MVAKTVNCTLNGVKRISKTKYSVSITDTTWNETYDFVYIDRKNNFDLRCIYELELLTMLAYDYYMKKYKFNLNP